jgi:hypothetical protein
MRAVEFDENGEHADDGIKYKLNNRVIAALNISHRNELVDMTSTILVMLADVFFEYQ